MSELSLEESLSIPQKALSPFTWNNLTLPPLAKSLQTQPKFHSQNQNLAVIVEGREKKKKRDKLSASIQLNARPIEGKMETLPSKNLTKPRRSNRKPQSEKVGPEQKVDKAIQLRQKGKSVYSKLHVPAATSTTSQPCKRLRFLDSKHNMEQYLHKTLQKQQFGQLLWANIERPTDHTRLEEGQFYNHIAGTHHMTTKDGLHCLLAPHSYPFYPSSFLLPQDYDYFEQSNSQLAVLAMTNELGQQVETFVGPNWEEPTWLGRVLQSGLLEQGSEDNRLLLRLCMYLEIVRVDLGYDSYFQSFRGYQKVSIKPTPTLFQPLLATAIQYLNSEKRLHPQIDLSCIDYRLLVLFLHYHKLFSLNHASYHWPAVWIVKPMASSRGAGISLLKANGNLCEMEEKEWYYFKNRKKYENKIMQQYIANPYLLETGPLKGRKFDIRQWVLLVSGDSQIATYLYHTAYCRFASNPYSLVRLDSDIHLTNYSLHQQEGPSVMMLEELFAAAKEDLRSKYHQQATYIVKQVVSHCPLQPQQGCFQLLGFDFLLDAGARLHLLEVNLNPACASQRHPPLQKEAQAMAQSMLQLVTHRQAAPQWISLQGPDFALQSQSSLPEVVVQVKPFYEHQLGQHESLISLVRHRRRAFDRFCQILSRYWGALLLIRLKGESCVSEGGIEAEGESSLGEIRFIEQKSTSNI